MNNIDKQKDDKLKIISEVMMEYYKIHVWADYSWCYSDELEDNLNSPMAKSDDFITVEINFDDEPTLEQLKGVVDGV